jgi:hypothetical protein
VGETVRPVGGNFDRANRAGRKIGLELLVEWAEAARHHMREAFPALDACFIFKTIFTWAKDRTALAEHCAVRGKPLQPIEASADHGAANLTISILNITLVYAWARRSSR